MIRLGLNVPNFGPGTTPETRPAGDDRQSLLQIAAAVDDIVTRASG